MLIDLIPSIRMNVLILTDLSDVAKNAGSYAVQFLSEITVSFYMLNIELFNPEPSLAKEKKEVALKKLHQRMEELQEISKNKDHKFTALYSENDLVSATRKYADEKKIDLIVMGAAHKGHSPITIIGNHTYEVIKKIRYNILAVAEHCNYKPVKRMVFPIDYSASVDEDILNFFKRPGIADGAEFTLLENPNFSSNTDTDSRKRLFSQLSDKKINTLPMENKEIYSDTHLKKIQRSFDLIVMLGKNLSVCDSFLHTEHGIYSKATNTLPILVLHGRVAKYEL